MSKPRITVVLSEEKKARLKEVLDKERLSFQEFIEEAVDRKIEGKINPIEEAISVIRDNSDLHSAMLTSIMGLIFSVKYAGKGDIDVRDDIKKSVINGKVIHRILCRELDKA